MPNRWAPSPGTATMAEPGTATVLIADDHPLFREALRQVAVAALPGCDFDEASSLDQAMKLASAKDYDLILLDLRMPGNSGFNGLVGMRNRAPATPIIIVSAEEDPDSMQGAITYGASGFIPKSLPKDLMAQAVRDVLSGEVYLPPDGGERPCGAANWGDDDLGASIASLTGQQRRVLELMVAGKPNKIIAYELDIAESTVKAHVSAILRKLRVTSRTQAVINAGKIAHKLKTLDA